MKIHDISWPISEAMTSYKNQYPVKKTILKHFQHDACRLSSMNMSNHTGTHVDAPSHFLDNGTTIDQMSLEAFCGHCHVIDLTHINEKITADDLAKYESLIIKNQFILYKTKNSFCTPQEPFNHDFIYLDQSAALYLVSKKIKGIGFDYLGIERGQAGHETHIYLMQHNITIVEGLRLAHVHPQAYFFTAFPLLIEGADGAPSRAVLYENFNIPFSL